MPCPNPSCNHGEIHIREEDADGSVHYSTALCGTCTVGQLRVARLANDKAAIWRLAGVLQAERDQADKALKLAETKELLDPCTAHRAETVHAARVLGEAQDRLIFASKLLSDLGPPAQPAPVSSDGAGISLAARKE